MAKTRQIKVGVIGYGPAFGMGKHHLSSMRNDAGMIPTAVCDISEERFATARNDSLREQRAYKKYCRNIRDHILKGTPLVITPELARRVIQVLQYACLSAQQGKALKAKYR